MQISFAGLSCSNLAALSCSNLAALSCGNVAALSCSNLAAHCLWLFVCRVCRPSCRLFMMGRVWNKKNQCREKLCVTHMSKLAGTQAILQVYYIFLVWHKNGFNLKPGNI